MEVCNCITEKDIEITNGLNDIKEPYSIFKATCSVCGKEYGGYAQHHIDDKKEVLKSLKTK